MEGATSSLRSQSARVAVVTGGNKGIGLEVCRQLAASGITVVLTARDETRGVEAAERLRGMGLSSVVFHQLEVTDSSSVARLADFLKTRFGKLDILASSPSPCSIDTGIQQLLLAYRYSASDLTSDREEMCSVLQVNNAAVGGMEYAQGVDNNEEQFVGMDVLQRLQWMRKQGRETYDTAKNGVQTNYYGAKHVIQGLLPLLLSSSEGKIVNVSSALGLLRFLGNEDLRKELDDIDNLTEERLDEVLASFLKDFEAGELEAHGWPMGSAAYKVAKVAMNAYTRISARKHPALRINCAHPGYVKTDLTINSGFLTPEEGARNVVTVALLPDGGPTGAFFDEGKEASFV
uniref:Salutaridine reductase n=1 Tax=Oryza barthii TaxID=65489 RepID=A0A0D3FYA8_9ORYZ